MDCPEDSWKNRTVWEPEGWSYWDQSFLFLFNIFLPVSVIDCYINVQHMQDYLTFNTLTAVWIFGAF